MFHSLRPIVHTVLSAPVVSAPCAPSCLCFLRSLASPYSSLANYYVGYGLKRLGRQAAALGQGDVKEAAEKELPETERPQ